VWGEKEKQGGGGGEERGEVGRGGRGGGEAEEACKSRCAVLGSAATQEIRKRSITSARTPKGILIEEKGCFISRVYRILLASFTDRILVKPGLELEETRRYRGGGGRLF